MNDVLRLLRYNTGNDKKSFIEFKEHFDAAIFNARIVAHSRSAVADIVSVHKQKYIIDPETHIFQHEIDCLLSKDRTQIKPSVQKYLEQLPENLANIVLNNNRPLVPSDISDEDITKLVDAVYDFETGYVNAVIKGKDYDKYLAFAGIGPSPKVIIAPYFMLKKQYNLSTINEWMRINRECLHRYVLKNAGCYSVAAQLVLDKEVLFNPKLIESVKQTYNVSGCEYIFVWVSGFTPIDANEKTNKMFKALILALNSISLKPIMAYGGYDSIILCNKEAPSRLYGVAQSVGYGEEREITPVGGGLPVNKYYFPPTHKRLKFGDAAGILFRHGYFDEATPMNDRIERYHKHICNCKQCMRIIEDDINNFNQYNESKAFSITYKNKGTIERNKPTTEAALIAATHFMWCKVFEWRNVLNHPFDGLVSEWGKNVERYMSQDIVKFSSWYAVYGRK
ncbi:MAG: hypothetical protein VB099_07075 [Candidatus Limiplasma sp.]|nr:hypothetical protein [Candidatus Limiplasma sp.]